MGDATQEPSPSDALWRFSVGFYGLPGVARALIALQDRDGVDVNMMLFALWLGVSGRGLISNDGLKAADHAVCTIRAEVIGPLRALRLRLKHNPDADVQRLREDVKALELAAEKLAQTRLGRFAGPSDREISPDARLTNAYANLALYLGPERMLGAEVGAIREALKLLAPDL